MKPMDSFSCFVNAQSITSELHKEAAVLFAVSMNVSASSIGGRHLSSDLPLFRAATRLLTFSQIVPANQGYFLPAALKSS
jgi:hypothetical protein